MHPLLFLFSDTATTEIYTLSLHDALPICDLAQVEDGQAGRQVLVVGRVFRNEVGGRLDDGFVNVAGADAIVELDRKSTRLNSSHVKISYAVFCLKKKRT